MYYNWQYSRNLPGSSLQVLVAPKELNNVKSCCLHGHAYKDGREQVLGDNDDDSIVKVIGMCCM